MGGTVAVTVRKEDGTVIPMHRWTNSLPYWIKTRKFIENPSKTMEEYIYQDQEDSEAFVAPEGYGLVVIDLKEKKILSYQDYTTFDLIFGTAKFSIDLNLRDTLDFKLKDAEIPFLNFEKRKQILERYEREGVLGDFLPSIEEEFRLAKDIYWFVTNGRITVDTEMIKNSKLSKVKKTIQYIMQHNITKKLNNNAPPLEKWKALLKVSDSMMRGLIVPFKVDLSPFEVLDYRISGRTERDSVMAMKKKLEELDFNLKDVEEKWNEYLSFYDE